MRNLGKGSFLDVKVPILSSKLSDILTSKSKAVTPSAPSNAVVEDGGSDVTTEDPSNYVIPG